MNNIDVEKLSQEELYDLYRKIVRRINALHRSRVAEKLQEFDIGDEVSFEHEGDIITGTVIRVNKKTLSIRTDRGHWYIDPRCATKNLGDSLITKLSKRGLN
jgi:hypothetical protein